MISRRLARDRIGPVILLIVVALVLAACAGVGAPGASGSGSPLASPTPHPPLTAAQPGADPVSLLSWAFTPIFQAMFIVLVAVYAFLEGLGVPAAIGWSIVVLTLVAHFSI